LLKEKNMPDNKSDVEGIFGPLYPLLRLCVRKAIRRFFEINQDELGAIHNRTKSSYINDMVVKNLKEMLPDDVKPQWENKNSQRRVWIAGSVCLRVKKVNRDLNPNNIATQAQFDFYESLMAPQFRFDNMHPPIPLILGFTMNRTNTAEDKVFLIHADGVLNSRRRKGIERIKPIVKWAILIPDFEDGTPAERLPLVPPSQPDTIEHTRIRIKDTSKAKKNK
jgi:hypothetical protein